MFVYLGQRRYSISRLALAAVCASGMMCSAVWACQPGAVAVSARIYPLLVAVTMLQATYFMVQLLQWLRYREVAAVTGGAELPTLAVVIPAYNEGAMVRRSIESVCHADYPADKLRLVVVDDGSRDDTFAHIEAAARDCRVNVQTLRMPVNGGKRAALCAGFAEATSATIWATLDSDSIIDKGALKALVAPFVHNERVGAVAGSVKVLNRHTWLGRMLDVRYFLAFDFTRAAQSTYGAVAVCPGAMSAFRSALIRDYLPAWCTQTFFGRPVRHGEDQALTNWVLRHGHDTVFQSSAKVYTLVPTQYLPLCHMYARWERSFIVEGLSFARFMLTRYRPDRRFWPAVHFVMELTRLVMLAAWAVALPSLLLVPVGTLLRLAGGVVLAGLWSGLLVLTTGRNFRFVFGVAYALFSLLFLQWIFPYALLTVREERWGTR